MRPMPTLPTELPGPGRRKRQDHVYADAQQIVCPGRTAVWLPRRPASDHDS